jgi:hypothetical protein
MNEIFFVLSQSIMVFLFFIQLAVPLAITVVCFFMSRWEEKRSGRILFSGKGAIIFTLMNNAFWLMAIAATIGLFNIVGDFGSGSYDSFTEGQIESTKDWSLFRLSIAIFFPSLIAVTVLGFLWRNWTDTWEFLPRDNIFVKCFSGLNCFILSCLVLGLAILLVYLSLELMVNDRMEWDRMGDEFKLMIVSFITSSIFLWCNLLVFGRSSDTVTPGAFTPLQVQNSGVFGEHSSGQKPHPDSPASDASNPFS